MTLSYFAAPARREEQGRYRDPCVAGARLRTSGISGGVKIFVG